MLHKKRRLFDAASKPHNHSNSEFTTQLKREHCPKARRKTFKKCRLNMDFIFHFWFRLRLVRVEAQAGSFFDVKSAWATTQRFYYPLHMNCTCYISACLCAFWIMATVGINHSEATGGPTLSDPTSQILNDWEKRRHESGIIRYRFSGDVTWLPGSLPETPSNSAPTKLTLTIPPEGISGKVSVSAVLDFVNNRWRLEDERDDLGSLGASIEHFHYLAIVNGGTYKCQRLPGSSIVNGEKIDFIITTGDAEAIPAGPFHLTYWRPVFFSSGVVATKVQNITGFNIAPRNNPTAFKFESYELRAGEQLAILLVDSSTEHTTNHVRYWVDLNRGSVIVKYLAQVTRDGKQRRQFICDIDYALAGKLWFPKSWIATETLKEKASYRESFTVSEVTPNPAVSDETFRLDPATGMRVIERNNRWNPDTKVISVTTEKYILERDGRKTGLEQKSQKIETRNPYESRHKATGARLVLLVLSALLPIWICVRMVHKRNR